jgi:histidine--tRNA ligase
MKKQMGYADAKKINYVALVGETEIEAGKITLKNMITGEQQLLSVEDIISFINK